MRKSIPLIVAAVASIVVADAAVAQPRPYGEAWGHQGQQGPDRPGDRQNDRHDNRREGQGDQRYYYNGRWVGADEWNRRGTERDRWAQTYQRRYPDRKDNNDSQALIAGIIGFALGAAIVGSQQQAEKARTADSSFDSYCARKYRSYDRRSRTYMGKDGLRHYCQ
jgi:hypothetical protein